MDKRRHRNFTVLFGSIFAASLLANIAQILIYDPKGFIEMFDKFKEVGMSWIPYISLTVVFLSALGAVGLIGYKQWGFYSIYLSYLGGALVAWFPFFPDFVLQSTRGTYGTVITLVLLSAVLIFLIYLHLSGRKGLYFKKPAGNMENPNG